jgi:hypothetical protein
VEVISDFLRNPFRIVFFNAISRSAATAWKKLTLEYQLVSKGSIADNQSGYHQISEDGLLRYKWRHSTAAVDLRGRVIDGISRGCTINHNWLQCKVA